MEPMAFAFDNNNFGGIVSDQYSFYDMPPESLEAKGNGGMSQMHNYVDLNMSNQTQINCPSDETDYKSSKISPELTIEQLQKQRDSDMNGMFDLSKRPI